MVFNEKDVYEKLWYKLYKAKNIYGVDVITEINNNLTKVIQTKLKKTELMNTQQTKWYEKTNLAIYKEDLGIIPIENFFDLETANKKIIPMDEDIPDYYYGYIFIINKSKTNIVKDNRAILVVEENKFILKQSDKDFAFLIREELELGGKTYLTFSAIDYLDKMSKLEKSVIKSVIKIVPKKKSESAIVPS